MAQVESTLRKALESEGFVLSPLLEQARKKGRRSPVADMEFPSHVSIDNQADPYFTLIEVQAPDRVGLLHDLLQCFSRNEIDIALARISTESGAAIDTFYVTDRRSHSKLTGTQRMNALHQELHAAAFGS
jgi:[protein-PII] uridylyltransferase